MTSAERQLEDELVAKLVGLKYEHRSDTADSTMPLYSLTIEKGVTAKTERYEREFLVTSKEDAYKLVLPDDFTSSAIEILQHLLL